MSKEENQYGKIIKEYIFSKKLSTKNKLRLITGSLYRDDTDISVIQMAGYIVISRLKNIIKLSKIYDKSGQVTKIEVKFSSIMTSNHLDATRLFYSNNLLITDNINFFVDSSGDIIFKDISNLTNEHLYKIYIYIKSLNNKM